MPSPSSRSSSISESTFARSSAYGPITIPATSSSTTSGISLRRNDPAISGAIAAATVIQKSDVATAALMRRYISCTRR